LNAAFVETIFGIIAEKYVEKKKFGQKKKGQNFGVLSFSQTN